MESPKKKKLRFTHHENLSSKVMALLVGRTGCGKTFLMFKILTTPNFLDYNNLIIFTTTQEQPIYQFLKYGFQNKLKKEVIRHLFNVYEESDDDEDIEEMCKIAAQKKELISKDEISVLLTNNMSELSSPSKLPKDKKNCVVFDDCINEKDQTVQKTYFTRGRHANCSCFYLTQSFYGLDGSFIRKNANIFILFELNNRNLSELLKDLAVENREDFKQQCKNTWSKDYSYVTVNIDKRPDGRVIESLFD